MLCKVWLLSKIDEEPTSSYGGPVKSSVKYNNAVTIASLNDNPDSTGF